MTRPYIRLRETTFDLYVERDLLPGYYRIISILSAWVVLAGYVLFNIVFTSRDDDLNANRNLVTAVASALLIVGYVGVVVVALLCRSLLFMIDGVIYPILTASLLGLFMTIANFLLHTRISTSQIYMSIPLVTACVTTVVSAVILFIAYRELGKIRSRDERRRWHVQLGPYIGSGGDPRMLSMPGPDDEAQRRQLARLLHDRQESISNLHDINNTFQIDIPGEPKLHQRQDSLLRRGDSPVRGGFFSNLMPWRAKTTTFKDARERRREEIERGSVPDLNEAWKAHDPAQNQNTQPPAWGWPPATRYA